MFPETMYTMYPFSVQKLSGRAYGLTIGLCEHLTDIFSNVRRLSSSVHC